MAESIEASVSRAQRFDELVAELFDKLPQLQSDGMTSVETSGSTSESNSANVDFKPMNNKENPPSLDQMPGTKNTTVLFRVSEYVSMSHQAQKPKQTSRFSNRPYQGEDETPVNEQAELRYQAPLNITWDMVHAVEAGE